ncbi:MAG: Ig-like domain-containing protein [Alphaproteobacteria bacterium]|nr:Ig-like domain-containing protein [Alphaproteobacteria bacterium]
MNRPLVYWGVAALAVAVIIGVVVFFQLPSPDTLPMQAQPPVAEPKGGEAPTPQTAKTAGDPALQPTVPEFDIVRVDDNGNVVIAGRATPDCTIVVRDGDAIVGTATVDRRGDWVVVPDEPLTPGDRQLSLIAECGDAEPVESDRVVVLAVPEQGGGALAVAVAREGSAPAQVLQTPTSAQSTADGSPLEVAVASVDYDDAGNVALSGTAVPGGTVQVYVDNELIGRADADQQGRWTLTPDRKVDPGSYTLRVDQVTPDGKVVARSQIPFVRGEPLTDLPPGRVVIIQPGDYLWRIARERYGVGTQYTLIYEANRTQIRDPDLIFPGQIFMMPTVN